MNHHSQTYFDLNPERQDTPSPAVLIVGTIVISLAVYALILVLFTL